MSCKEQVLVEIFPTQEEVEVCCDTGKESLLVEACFNVRDWLPSDVPIASWYDGADEDTITESGGKVSQWDDKSPREIPVIQTNGSDQPSYGTRTLNGLNVLDFDGNSFLRATNFEFETSDLLIAVVYEADSVYSQFNSVYSLTNDFSPEEGFQFQAAENSRFVGELAKKDGANVNPSNGPYPGPAINVAEFNLSGNFAATYYNGLLDGIEENFQDITVFRDFKIFSNRLTTSPLNGACAELIVSYDTSPEKRQLLEGYLACKWGLQSELPNDHTYKTACPTIGEGCEDQILVDVDSGLESVEVSIHKEKESVLVEGCL